MRAARMNHDTKDHWTIRNPGRQIERLHDRLSLIQIAGASKLRSCCRLAPRNRKRRPSGVEYELDRDILLDDPGVEGAELSE